MKQIRPLVPKGAIYADDYNALAQELMRQANMSIEGLPDSQIDDTTAGRGITLPRPFFGIWARISNPDNAAAPWAWRQVRPIENGQFADMIDSEGPREGFVTRDPLYPSDGEIVPDNAVRFIVKGCAHTDGSGVQQDWLTLSGGTAGGGGGGGNCCETHVSQLYCCLPRCIGFFAAYIAGTGPVSVYGVYIWNRVENAWAAATSCCGSNDNVTQPNPCQALIRKGRNLEPDADWLTITIPTNNGSRIFSCPARELFGSYTNLPPSLTPPPGCPNNPNLRQPNYYQLSPSSGFPDLTQGFFFLLQN